MRRLPHSLQWRLPVLIVALIGGVLALFLWLSYRDVKGALLGQGAERASTTATQLANLTAPSLRQRNTDLRRVAADATLR